MNAETIAKMLASTYPREAVWRMAGPTGGEMDAVGLVLSATTESFVARTRQNDIITQKTADVLTLSFVGPNSGLTPEATE